MKKIFSINTTRKKQLHKNFIKSKPIVRGLQYLFPTALLIFTVVFAVYAFDNPDSFIVQLQYDSDYGQKDMVFII